MNRTAKSDSGAKTRSQQVYNVVRAEILAGRIRPGDRLSPSEISADLGFSLSVVREALTRLAEQGLVLAQPQQGFQVTPISPEDLLELTDARLQIETTVLRRSIDQGDVEWEGGILAALHRMERTAQFDPAEPGRMTEEWADSHSAFHRALLEGCGNRRLLDMAHSLRDSAELYRRWSGSIGHDLDRDTDAEHRAIADLSIARDADAAAEARAAHISHTTSVLLSHAPAE